MSESGVWPIKDMIKEAGSDLSVLVLELDAICDFKQFPSAVHVLVDEVCRSPPRYKASFDSRVNSMLNKKHVIERRGNPFTAALLAPFRWDSVWAAFQRQLGSSGSVRLQFYEGFMGLLTAAKTRKLGFPPSDRLFPPAIITMIRTRMDFVALYLKQDQRDLCMWLMIKCFDSLRDYIDTVLATLPRSKPPEVAESAGGGGGGGRDKHDHHLCVSVEAVDKIMLGWVVLHGAEGKEDSSDSYYDAIIGQRLRKDTDFLDFLQERFAINTNSMVYRRIGSMRSARWQYSRDALCMDYDPKLPILCQAITIMARASRTFVTSVVDEEYTIPPPDTLLSLLVIGYAATTTDKKKNRIRKPSPVRCVHWHPAVPTGSS